jgi:hypothetical protein
MTEQAAPRLTCKQHTLVKLICRTSGDDHGVVTKGSQTSLRKETEMADVGRPPYVDRGGERNTA